MPFSCPVKSDPSWKALVKQVGYTKAYEMFVENDFNIPGIDQNVISFSSVFYDQTEVKNRLENSFRDSVNQIESEIPLEQQKDRYKKIGVNKAVSDTLFENSILQNKATGKLYVIDSMNTADQSVRGEDSLAYYEDGLNPSEFFVYNLNPVIIDSNGFTVLDVNEDPVFNVSTESISLHFTIAGEMVDVVEKLDNKEKLDDLYFQTGQSVMPLKGNEDLYKKYNLLTKDGKIQQVDPKSKKTKDRLASLNRSPYYQFVIKQTPSGHSIFILNNSLNQVSSKEAPSKALDKKVSKFLETIGVQVNSLEEIKVKDKDGNELSIVAKSSLLKGIIDIANGRRGKDTLTEEAAHFLVELLGDSHPLVKQMIENVDKFGVYQQVVDEYGGLEAYSDDDRKLRKEAVGKLIAKLVVEDYDKNDRWWSWLKNAFDNLMRWFGVKTAGKKSVEFEAALADFQKAADMIINNDTSELMKLENLKNVYKGEQEFYQVDALADAARKHALEILSKDVVRKEGKNYVHLSTFQTVKQRVTDIVKRMNFEVYHSYDKQDEKSKAAAIMGTMIHSAMQHIFNARMSGEVLTVTELRKRVKDDLHLSDETKHLDDNFFDKNLSADVIGVLVKTANEVKKTVDEIEERIKSSSRMTDEEWEERKPIYITEKAVYNSLIDVAGTIDLMVVHSNGAISIFDWKSMKFQMYDKTIISDVHTSKRYAFDIQTSLYKSAVADMLDTDNFAAIRIVPINVQLDSKGNIYRIQSFNKDNTSTYLEHIPSAVEKTGIESLDKHLEIWTKQRENLQKEFLENKRRKSLLPKIQKLDQMIREAQMRREFSFVSDALNDLQERFLNKEPWNDRDRFSQADYCHNILEELLLYKGFIGDAIVETDEKLAKLNPNSDEYKALLVTMAGYDAANKQALRLERAIHNKTIELFHKVGKPGTLKNFLARYFNKLSDFDRGSFQELYDIVRDNYETVRQSVNTIVDTMAKAVDNLGMSETEAYKKLYNPTSGNLYVRTSKKFYEDRENAIKEKNIKWFLENTDLEREVSIEGEDEVYRYKYKGKALERFNKARASKQADLESNPGRTFKDEASKQKYIAEQLTAFDQEFDISKAKGSVFEFTMAYLHYNNNGNYDSAEWLEIQNNAGLKQYYDTYLSVIKELNDLQGVEVDDNFVANVHRSLLENATYAGGFGFDSIKESLWDLVSVQQEDAFGGYLSADVDAYGKPVQRIPLLYSNQLQDSLTKEEEAAELKKVNDLYDKEGWEKSGVDYEQHIESTLRHARIKKGKQFKSMDLTRSLVLFAKSAYTHDIFQRTEGAMKLLRFSLESDSERTILKDWKGNVKLNKIDGSVAYQKGVPELEKEAFDGFMNMHWYGDQGISGTGTKSTFDVSDGKRQFSAMKALNTFLRGTTMSAMALKPLLAFGNFAGGMSNAVMKAFEGNYFNLKTLKEAQVAMSKRDPMYAASVKFWEPSSHDLTLEKANKLSASKLTEWFTASNMYILHRLGTDTITNNVLVAMLKSYGIDPETGKVRQLNKIKGNVKSLYDLQELTEKGLTIPGLNPKEFTKFRAIVRNQMTMIMGEMSEADKNLANSNMMLRFLMQFRNWMPGLISTRFKAFSQSVIDDEFDVGRFRVLIGEFTKEGFVPKMKAFKDLALEVFFITSPKANIERSEYYYKKYLREQRLTEKDISMQDFIDLRTAKLRGMVMEIRLYLGIILAMLGARGMIPDDKDDPTRQYYVTLYRMVSRAYLEVGFFLDPSAMKNVFKGLVPQLSFIGKVESLVTSVLTETYYSFAEDDRKRKPKPPDYYLFKMIPGPAGTVIDLFDAYDTYKVGGGYIY